MVTVWKGAINFGLINVPVKLLVAVNKENIAFKNLHKECKTPINQKRWCSSCNKEVPYEDIVKGYEYEKGKFVVIEDDELSSLPVKSSKYIQIVDFIKLEEIDPVYYEKTYYLAPEQAGEKPYLVLFKAMQELNRVAVAKVTIREKEHLCVIRIYKDILALETMFFSNEVRPTEAVGIEKILKKNEVSKMEMDMAKQIVENLTAEFDIDKYHDEYREALLKLINAKVEGDEIVQPVIPSPEKEKVSDFMERLRKSVEATKNGDAFKKSQHENPQPPSYS